MSQDNKSAVKRSHVTDPRAEIDCFLLAYVLPLLFLFVEVEFDGVSPRSVEIQHFMVL